MAGIRFFWKQVTGAGSRQLDPSHKNPRDKAMLPPSPAKCVATEGMRIRGRVQGLETRRRLL